MNPSDYGRLEPNDDEGPECPKCGAEMISTLDRKGSSWYYTAECPTCGYQKETDNL